MYIFTKPWEITPILLQSFDSLKQLLLEYMFVFTFSGLFFYDVVISCSQTLQVKSQFVKLTDYVI